MLPLDWDDACMFLAVARAGQMLSASRFLGVNQATLSRRMAALEALSAPSCSCAAPTAAS